MAPQTSCGLQSGLQFPIRPVDAFPRFLASGLCV